MTATYSIDTSVLINNWRKHYPPDVFPSVWDFTSHMIDSGIALVSWEVLEELTKKDDELLAWLKQYEARLVPTSDTIQQLVIGINDQFPRLVDDERERGTADPFVIAVGESNNCAVVTYEEPRTRSTKPPRIPDVVAQRGFVRCLTFLDMARAEGLRI